MNVFKVRSDIGFIYFLKSFYFGVVEIVYAGEVSSKKFGEDLGFRYLSSSPLRAPDFLEVKVHSLFCLW